MTGQGKGSFRKTNIILFVLVVAITVAPFFFHPRGAEFGGADDQGPALIQKEHPGYQVWFKPVWRPPSDEIESLLFALQAGLGAGIVGYVLGYMRGKKQHPKEQVESSVEEKGMLS